MFWNFTFHFDLVHLIKLRKVGINRSIFSNFFVVFRFL